MRGLSRRFIPRFDDLENRWCPSTIFVRGDTMVILGDGDANTVTVTHDGEGGVTATIDDEAETADGIERIVVATFGGADTINLDVMGELTTDLDVFMALGSGDDTADLDFAAVSDDLTVRADLGSGDDLFDVNLDQELKTGADVRLDVRGRDGADEWNLSVNEVRADAELNASFDGGDDDDVLDVFLGDPIDEGAEVQVRGRGGDGDDALTVDATTFGTGANIAEDAELKVFLDGGDGDDTLTATYEGDVDGELHIRLDGDDGDDTASATVTVGAGSTGEAQVHVNGGKGNDTLTLLLTDDSDDEAEVKGRIDGGKGFDTCVATPNVKVKRCEA